MIRKLIFIVFFNLFFQANFLAQNHPVFYNSSDSWADSVITSLSLDEKIAQLFMVAAYSNKGEKHKQEILDLIDNYNIGGLMFLQGGPVRQAQLINFYQERSLVPLMIAMDAEWGVSMRLDSSLRFPWQMTLGAMNNEGLIYEMGVEVARQCKMLGVHINFAPVIDVNSNPKNPIINNRSFGQDPIKVANMGMAYMNGMQDNHVLACAKHFPGHGDTDSDSHKTLPVIHHKRDRLDLIELFPFQKLINQGLGSVMVAHLNVPALDSIKDMPSSLSDKVVNKLLKKEMNFSGLVITDALNMKGVTNYYKPGLLDVKALIAGNDILLLSTDVPKAINEIKLAIQNNQISEDEIEQRCRKVLMAKKWMGLDYYRPVDLTKITQNITIDQTEILNKKMINSSLTLLQNHKNILPLTNLDTLKIACLSIGDQYEPFQKMLVNYASIENFHINNNATIHEQALLLQELAKYNLVIIGVHNSNKDAWQSYKITKNTDVLLQSIALQNKVVLSIFGNPYSINSLLFANNFDGLVLSYQNSLISQEQTAQAIFGGIAFKGTLPVSTKHFDIGTGIFTSETRMSYVSINEIKLNANMYYKIDSIVEKAIQEKAMPGCQILIAKDGKIFFNQSYGYHTYNKEQKVDNRDVYDLASITKIAATLPVLMKMVDDNDLDIDCKIGSYLDLDSTNKKDLVIREILAHQSGLKPWIPFYKRTLESDSISGLIKLRDTLYNFERSIKFPFQVADSMFLHYSFQDSILLAIYNSDLLENKEYRYSDLGYYLFKNLIEGCYNSSLDSIVDQYFYKRIGVENLGYLPLQRINKSRIIPTEEDFEFRGQLLKGHVHDMGAAMQGGVGGHAGLFSNANDLAKIMQLYLNKGKYGGERYISKSVVEEFIKCQYCINENRRGLGFDKPALEGKDEGATCQCVSYLSFGHTGFTGTLAWADPETNIIYIFLSNRIHPDANNRKLLEKDVRTNIMQVIFDSLYE